MPRARHSGWTSFVADPGEERRRTRRWAVAQAPRQLDAVREA
jgi:hypothetical protein